MFSCGPTFKCAICNDEAKFIPVFFYNYKQPPELCNKHCKSWEKNSKTSLFNFWLDNNLNLTSLNYQFNSITGKQKRKFFKPWIETPKEIVELEFAKFLTLNLINKGDV